MLDKSPHNRGQSLVELMVALGVIIFGILGVFTLLSRSIGINRIVLDRYISTNLAAEGIEIVKNLIDTNVIQKKAWNDSLSNGNYEVDHDDVAVQSAQDRVLLLDPNTPLYQYGSGNPTTFKRIVTIELSPDGNEMKVNSRVDWTTRSAEFSLDLEDHFYNWR